MTQVEIDAEIKRLKRLTPVEGPYKRNVAESIAMAIEQLEEGVDTTTEEFANLPSVVTEAVYAARLWQEGSSKDRPSDGYGKLVKRCRT